MSASLHSLLSRALLHVPHLGFTEGAVQAACPELSNLALAQLFPHGPQRPLVQHWLTEQKNELARHLDGQKLTSPVLQESTAANTAAALKYRLALNRPVLPFLRDVSTLLYCSYTYMYTT